MVEEEKFEVNVGNVTKIAYAVSEELDKHKDCGISRGEMIFGLTAVIATIASQVEEDEEDTNRASSVLNELVPIERRK